MQKRNHVRPLSRLEMLENRTLLAGDAAAITSSSSYLTNFDPTAGASQSSITIAGTAGGELTIDASLLPSSIKDLTIGGFDKVTITGSEKLDSLDLVVIGSFSGAQVDVTGGLRVYDVASLTLHSIAGLALIAGHETRLDVFDSRSATIYSTLDRLTVSSSNDLVLISGNPQQVITLEFHSNNSELMGPIQQVIYPGDLTPDAVHTFNGTQSTYNVIVLSLAATQNKGPLITKLQNALTQGDLDAVKTAFADYFSSIKLPQNAYAITSLASAPLDYNPAGLARLASVSDSFDGIAQEHLGNRTATQPVGRDLPNFNARVSAPSLNRLLDKPDSATSASTSPAELLATTSGSISTKSTSSSDQAIHPADGQSPQQNDGSPMLERVRLTLSTLVTEVDSNINTVTAYLVDKVGSELEPGTLPALLVEARSSRSGRETNWVQI